MSDELQLIKKIKSYNNYVDENVIINAYKYASELHKTQKRHSGDPYISHPVAVANILAELKLDGPTITTALLHDTIEDTKATYDEVKNNFGEEIADLVDGVTKISKLEVEKKTLTAGENFRKLILATSKDIRVLLVKLADRLHNIRTITSIDKKEKRERIAKETMEIYAPLAERMGMHKVRDELEDRSFAILNDDARSLIVNRVKEISPGRKKIFNEVLKEIEQILEKNNIDAEVIGREKTPFSIWRKVNEKRISLEQITDLIGFRIITKNNSDCYSCLGIFHSKWSAVPGRFKDYISTPKSNRYQSIHTTIIGPKRQRVEIQIRTQQMNDYAERGVAAHWLYKKNENIDKKNSYEYSWLSDLVELLESGENPEHYYEYTKLQLYADQVFCFTPNGAVIRLPKRATPIDFAYAVHTDLGDTCTGCKINGKHSPLQTHLRNGDLVEILSSTKKSPSYHWLSYAKTGKARSAIRRYWHDKLPVQNESHPQQLAPAPRPAPGSGTPGLPVLLPAHCEAPSAVPL